MNKLIVIINKFKKIYKQRKNANYYIKHSINNITMIINILNRKKKYKHKKQKQRKFIEGILK